MSIQLEPREYFAIVRQLPNPNDATTYYLRATIRNAKTDELIETVNLTDRGSRRFSANWQVPADTSGLGFYISVLTEVFTDSGYTTKGSKYADEMETYLVEARKRNLGGGGSGGADIDYKKIKRIVDQSIQEYEDRKEKPEEIDFSPVLKAIKEVKTCVEDMEMPEMEETDLSPVLQNLEKAVSMLSKKIDDKEVTPDTDLRPVLNAIDSIGGEDIRRAVADLRMAIETAKNFAETMPEYEKKLATLNEQLKSLPFTLVGDMLKAMKGNSEMKSQKDDEEIVKNEKMAPFINVAARLRGGKR